MVLQPGADDSPGLTAPAELTDRQMDFPHERGSLWGIRSLPFCVLLASVFPGFSIL